MGLSDVCGDIRSLASCDLKSIPDVRLSTNTVDFSDVLTIG